MRRSFTPDEKRLVGAGQLWRCSACAELLPGSYEVDHTVPLNVGGSDTLRNATAMCPNCHAHKSQLERVARLSGVKSRETLYDQREDTVVRVAGTEHYVCTLCKQRRPVTCAQHVCIEIEAPGAQRRALRSSLARFEFVPRTTAIVPQKTSRPVDAHS